MTKHTSPQDQYERYYFYFNEAGLLTCQLTNEPKDYCIKQTFKAISEVHRQAQTLTDENLIIHRSPDNKEGRVQS